MPVDTVISVLGEPLVVGYAHVLQTVVRVVNQLSRFLRAYNRLVEYLQWQRVCARMESDSDYPTILFENTSVTKAVYTNP